MAAERLSIPSKDGKLIQFSTPDVYQRDYQQSSFFNESIRIPPKVDRDVFGNPIFISEIEERRMWVREHPPESASEILRKLESGEYNCFADDENTSISQIEPRRDVFVPVKELEPTGDK